MKTKIVTLDNKESGDLTLNSSVFGVDVRADILARVVNWQLAKRRSGTHQTKTRSEVVGSTKKDFRQKGTGRARRSTTKVSQFRGGANAFGPKNRDYEYSLPKKVRKLGLKVALSSKCADKKIVVLDSFDLKNPKTKDLKNKLEKLGLKSALFIQAEKANDNFSKAVSNLVGFDVLPTDGLNVYDILKKESLVVTKEAVARIEERLA